MCVCIYLSPSADKIKGIKSLPDEQRNKRRTEIEQSLSFRVWIESDNHNCSIAKEDYFEKQMSQIEI